MEFWGDGEPGNGTTFEIWMNICNKQKEPKIFDIKNIATLFEKSIINIFSDKTEDIQE